MSSSQSLPRARLAVAERKGRRVNHTACDRSRRSTQLFIQQPRRRSASPHLAWDHATDQREPAVPSVANEFAAESTVVTWKLAAGCVLFVEANWTRSSGKRGSAKR
ncbi:hypothetical protein PMIN01_08724 [Paraphaeosphaeria minitans]|uniref:Uncharacterized protein n=1 Tax=Paraphaeosphaeria minitans TaxID=565426 RepID=A0A9P6KNI1_9PLEO|nr:hypothetical protein PMIN01_08724 [Paraphaeosphaeria minitans]